MVTQAFQIFEFQIFNFAADFLSQKHKSTADFQFLHKISKIAMLEY